MDAIEGIPYSAAEFDKGGKLLRKPTVPAGTTDLIVVSHGWNNDREAAEALYLKLFKNFADVTRGDAAIAARKIAIVGVIWPSKKFDDLLTMASGGTAAGGAASAGAGGGAASEQAALHAAIDRAAPLFDDPGDAERLKTLHGLIAKLDGNPQLQVQFVQTLRELVAPAGVTGNEATREDREDLFFRGAADAIFANASRPPTPGTGAAGASAAAGSGHAAGLGSVFSKIGNAVTGLVNLTTYFEMKKRAGTVGQQGLAPLIDELAGQVERVHLVGHSFGGRLVAAAAAHSTTPKLHSLALLQAAFSHNGFSSSRNGFFRTVAESGRVAGPILITHTKNDRAVGAAYPIASRVGQDSASALGDKDDQFGAIGSNGAQQMQAGMIAVETNKLLPVGGVYAWQPKRFHNLDATPFIVDPSGGDAHGFVFVREVAWALSRAVVS